MNDGPGSPQYNAIFENFKDIGWTTDDLDQFVGPNSAMKMFDNIFDYNVHKYLGENNKITPEQLAAIQWNSRALTENKDVPFVKSDIKSIYEFYAQDF